MMEMAQRIEVHIPGWHLAEYSEINHHIVIMDAYGNTVRLDAEHMVKYTCEECGEGLFARSNHGRIKCPCGYRMTPSWGQAQVCFVPKVEEEEDTDPQRPRPA